MEEKELITSKHGKVTLIICGIILILGIVSGFAFMYWNCSGDIRGRIIEKLPYHMKFTFVPALIIAIFVYFAAKPSSLTVTSKRVYGKTIFGKRVDLPNDSISAVGTGIFNGIAVATSSGKIKFFDFANRDELHDTISKLIIERQNKNSFASPTKIENIPSNADELKKYKDLLDSGVITQAEFDDKKKQLLGL